MNFLDPDISSCYVFDKNKGTVLGVTQNEIKNVGTEVKLQTQAYKGQKSGINYRSANSSLIAARRTLFEAIICSS